MPSDPSKASVYGAGAIKVLKGLEAVRKRAGMYIGDTGDGSGLHNMIYEALDHPLDQSLAGFVTEIVVSLNADGSATICDDGRGISSTAEVMLAELHAGGIYDCNPYKVSCGLHGVGLSFVNALSTRLDLRICRHDREHRIRFSNGIAEAPLEVMRRTDGSRGMEITFWPNLEVFRNVRRFDYATLEGRLRELACFFSGVRIDLKENSRTDTMCYPGGIADLLRHVSRTSTPLLAAPIMIRGQEHGISVRAALWWTDDPHKQVLCFANRLPQRNGGAHLDGFHLALARVIEDRANDPKVATADKVSITGDDACAGITAVLSVKMPDPRFTDQTKDELVSPDVKYIVESIVTEQLSAWLDAHPKQAEAILAKARKAASGRAIWGFARRLPTGRRV